MVLALLYSFVLPGHWDSMERETVSNRGVGLRPHYCQHVCRSWRQTPRVSLCNRMQSDNVLESRDTHKHTHFVVNSHSMCPQSSLVQCRSFTSCHNSYTFCASVQEFEAAGGFMFSMFVHHSYVQFSRYLRNAFREYFLNGCKHSLRIC